MHPRNRNLGNGYNRSGSMGMSMASSRGMSDSGRGRGYYDSGYRSFNRGFGRGRGNSKPYKQPQQLHPRGDIFMEAGRLAAEYLVSRGMLSPSVLSGKQQMGEMQEFRQREGDSLSVSADSRGPALSRLGSVVSDSGSGRRRYGDDYKQMGSRNSSRERRRVNFGSYSSDWSRENGRSGSWSDRSRFSPDREEDDMFSVHNEEQRGGKDSSAVQKSGSNESVMKNENIGVVDSEVEKYPFHDDMDSKASSSSGGKDKLNETGVELTNTSNGLSSLNDGTTDNETEKQADVTGSLKQHCAVEGDNAGHSRSGLLAFCKFAKVPTRIRSALTHKALKADAALNVVKEINLDVGLSKGSKVPNDDSRDDAQPIVSLEEEDLHPETSKTSLIQSGESVLPIYGVEQPTLRSRSFPGSQSFQGREFMHDYEQGSSQGPPGFGRSGSLVEERGEKRASEESNMREGVKKAREWIPSMVGRDDDCFQVSDSGEKEAMAQESGSLPLEKEIMDADQESLVTSSLFPKGSDEPCMEYAQEKQLFPNSYKICDLNLLGTSDVNDNHHTDPVIIYPSSSETKMEVGQVDIDLSIRNDMPGGYGRHATDAKEIEVIDLENDSDLERMTEPVFTTNGSFPNYGQTTGGVTDLGDYNDRLMISEFLDAFQNPVSEEINPLQNEIELPNGEGTLGDDDSIYMSLGEIPLSFLQGWEQPTPQPYEKPF